MDVHIPESLKKYYEVSDIHMFVEADLASNNDVNNVTEYAKAVLQSQDKKFLGWAIAKDKYREALTEVGFGFVCIAAKNFRTQLVAVFGETLVVLSETKLLEYL